MSEIEPVHVNLFGDERTEPCPCGCGQSHVNLKGDATRDDGSKIVFLALLATCGERRHLWLGVVSGSADPADPSNALFTVEVFLEDDNVRSRVAERHESPWRKHPAFAEDVRFWTREEVNKTPGVHTWLFGWTYALMTRGCPQLGSFVLGAALAG